MLNARTAIFFLLTLVIAREAFAQTPRQLVDSRRDCATCHIEWTPDFEQHQAPLLMDKPSKPAVGIENTCLGCHDGSVGDDRRTVWLEHGHKTGMKPPDTMQVPAGLPLENGKVECRTCHTAHAIPGSEDLSSTIFLRIENDKSQLCRLCHTDKDVGPQHGSHPIGKMTAAFPETLKAAGGKSGPKGEEVICQSCHSPHGSLPDKLLVMPVNSSQLCITCHDKMRPGMFRDGPDHEHPQNPPISSDAQRKAIKDMGTRLGSNDTLICMSCHKLHDSPMPRRLLADSLVDSKLCIRCHPSRTEIFSTKHDLRKTAPNEKNALGMLPAESGPCGACHSFHQYARDPNPKSGDPKGQCMTCHDQQRIAAKDNGGIHDAHPESGHRNRLPALAASLNVRDDPTDPAKVQIVCLSCHNPHESKNRKFLRADTNDGVCARCHVAELKNLAGKHDFTNRPELKNSKDKTAPETGRCGFCHSVHEANGIDMWNATKDSPKRPQELCIQCHREGGLAKNHPAPQFSHPSGHEFGAATRPSSVELPLFDASGHRSVDGDVACASCHNPHSDSTQANRMLRVSGTTSDLCIKCHKEESTLLGNAHDARQNPTAWPEDSKKHGSDPCLSCHQPHSNDPARKLWTRTPVANVAPADGACMGCHPKMAWPSALGVNVASTPTTQPVEETLVMPADMVNGDNRPTDPTATNFPIGTMLHPQMIPEKRAAQRGVLPLVPATGPSVSTTQPTAAIGCKTCHNPHSARGVRSLLRTPDPAQPAAVCFQCHAETKTIDHSMHARNLLPADPKSKLLCGPCHAVHAVEGSTQPKLWAGRMDPTGLDPIAQRCLGCHDDKTAKRPFITVHPSVAFSLAKSATTKPSDVMDHLPTDVLSCGTCHLPHGKYDPNDPLADAAKAIRAAGKPMLRDGVAKQICATCHGPDASRMFLYFHEPDRRRDVAPAVPAPAMP